MVRGGVSMHLPGKIFGRNFVEFAHPHLRVVVHADAAGALRRWAELSRQTVDDRRTGRQVRRTEGTEGVGCWGLEGAR